MHKGKLLTKHHKQGLSIIETIVAVVIITFVVGAPLGVLYQGLKLSQLSKQRVEMRFLAEEPLEYIRNIKDTNILRAIAGQSVTFGEGIVNAGCTGTGNCMVDVFEDLLVDCQTGSNPCHVNFTDAQEDGSPCSEDLAGCERRYGHNHTSGNTYEGNAGYARKVEIDIDEITPNEIWVEVEVTCDGACRDNTTYFLHVEEYLRSFGFDEN